MIKLKAEIKWAEITKKLEIANGRHFLYFLKENNIVVYVGRSSRIYDRLTNHKYNKHFDSIYLAETDTKYSLRILERKMIKKLNPIYNFK